MSNYKRLTTFKTVILLSCRQTLTVRVLRIPLEAVLLILIRSVLVFHITSGFRVVNMNRM